MLSSLRRNSLWLLLARLITHGFSFLLIVLVVRHLPVESFGQFTFIGAIVFIANTVTTFGTDTLLIRETAHARATTDLAARSFALQLFLSTLWFVITLLVTRYTPFLIYTLFLFPLALNSVSSATLWGFERMDLILVLTIFNGVVQLVAAYFSFDIATLCLFLLIGHSLTAVLYYVICRTFYPTFSLIPLKGFLPLLKLTAPFATLTILLVIIQRLGVLSVNLLLGDTSAGIFSSVTRIAEGLKLGHFAILGALLPAISRGTQASRQSFRHGFLLLITGSLLMAILLTVFPRPIILILYGEKFSSAIPLLALLGWALLPYTVSSFISYDLIARRQEITVAKAAATSLVIYIALYLWLISVYDLNGAIYAAVIGEIIQAVIFVIFQRRRDGITPSLQNNDEYI